MIVNYRLFMNIAYTATVGSARDSNAAQIKELKVSNIYIIY